MFTLNCSTRMSILKSICEMNNLKKATTVIKAMSREQFEMIAESVTNDTEVSFVLHDNFDISLMGPQSDVIEVARCLNFKTTDLIIQDEYHGTIVPKLEDLIISMKSVNELLDGDEEELTEITKSLTKETLTEGFEKLAELSA